MSTESTDLRTRLAEAILAADPEVAWYLDRRRMRVVRVEHGVVDDPLLRASEVKDDDVRFVEIPAVTEAEVHEWMAEFADEGGFDGAAAALDERRGANRRFEAKLSEISADALTAWHRFRQARVGELAESWLAVVRAEPLPPEE